jgi:hypothetical protein
MKIVRLLPELRRNPEGQPVIGKESVSAMLATLPQKWGDLPFDDLWDDADMVSVVAYLRGAKDLQIPEEWRPFLSDSL